MPLSEQERLYEGEILISDFQVLPVFVWVRAEKRLRGEGV
jgi:hypothetical protein